MISRRLPLISVLTAALLAAAGCSSEVNFERYSLTQQCTPAAYTNPCGLKVSLSPALSTGGIVLQTGPYTLLSAREHRWAQPLEIELTALLNQSLLTLCAASGDSKLQDKIKALDIQILVTTFQGSLSGEAALQFHATVKNAKGRELLSRDYHSLRQQQGAGYSELCRELQLGMSELGDQFWRNLRSVL